MRALVSSPLSAPKPRRPHPLPQGVFTAAQTFYLLFQHHTTLERMQQDGYWPGCGSSQLLRLGHGEALVLPDSRTFRCALQSYAAREPLERLFGLQDGRCRALVKRTRTLRACCP
jgi:hypothetical protein